MARFGDLDTQYFDDSGDPLVNGKVYFYETGTTTPKTTYADVDFTIPNTNPVILTAAGRQPNIFFDGVAKAILATSAGTQILVRDPIGDTANSFGNPWIASKRYSANDVVQGSDGEYYVSLSNGNVNNDPVNTTGLWTFLYSVEWNAGTNYKEGSVVTYESIVYQSLQNTNLNQNPSTVAAYWTPIQLSWISTQTYALNANVVGSDGVLYTSIQAANTGNEPSASPLWWVGTSAAAAASAAAALVSENAAAASETASGLSETAAAASASAASDSETAAGLSEVAAALSESNAESSASASSVSAAASLASQLAAASSAAAALVSENAAELAEANATGIVYGGGYSTTPVASNVPIADASGTLENWVNPSIRKVTNPLAQAVRVAMTGATSGSNGIQVLDSSSYDYGDGNFTMHYEGAVPDWTPSAIVNLALKYSSTSNRVGLLLNTNGTLNFIAIVGSTTIINATSTEGVPASNGAAAKITVVVVRETPTTDGSVSFYVDGVLLGALITITAATTNTLDTAANLFFNGLTSIRESGNFKSAILYNRALSASNVLSLAVNGPALTDIGASQTPFYTSDFSAGVDGWSAVSASVTLTGNIDAIGGVDNTLRLVSASSNSRILSPTLLPLSSSKYYRVSGRFYYTGNVNVAGIWLIDAAGNSLDIVSGTLDSNGKQAGTDGAWNTFSAVVQVAPTSTSTGIRLALITASLSSVVSVGDTLYVEGISSTQVGVTGWWDAEDCQGNTAQILDRSVNKNHAKLPVAGATRIPSMREFEIRWTNTWAGTHEAQYIGGVNEAILNAKAFITSIAGTVSGTTIEDIIIGDGSDADRFVTITTGLAAGTTAFAIASPTTDGTNLKLVVDPDANFTGSIAFVIRGYILES